MKNKIHFLILLLYLIPSYAFTQVYIGIKGGIGPSGMQVEGKKELELKADKKTKWLNYLGGIVVEYPVIAGFSVQLETQYITKGYRLEPNENSNVFIREGNYFSDYTPDEEKNNKGINDDGSVQSIEAFFLPNLHKYREINLHYMEIPLLFKYEFVGATSGFYVEIGPYFSFALKGEGKITLKDKDGNEEYKGDPPIPRTKDGESVYKYNQLMKSYLPDDKQKIFQFDPFKSEERKELINADHLRKNDVGFNIGGGIALDAGESRFYIGLRYALGLANLNLDKNGSKVEEDKHKNHSLQLSVTYVYPIGGY